MQRIAIFTRINDALLVGVLGVAILQYLLFSRDPQRAILYTLIAFSLVFMGGGRFSLDERMKHRRGQTTEKNV